MPVFALDSSAIKQHSVSHTFKAMLQASLVAITLICSNINDEYDAMT